MNWGVIVLLVAIALLFVLPWGVAQIRLYRFRQRGFIDLANSLRIEDITEDDFWTAAKEAKTKPLVRKRRGNLEIESSDFAKVLSYREATSLTKMKEQSRRFADLSTSAAIGLAAGTQVDDAITEMSGVAEKQLGGGSRTTLAPVAISYIAAPSHVTVESLRGEVAALSASDYVVLLDFEIWATRNPPSDVTEFGLSRLLVYQEFAREYRSRELPPRTDLAFAEAYYDDFLEFYGVRIYVDWYLCQLMAQLPLEAADVDFGLALLLASGDPS